jgi:hypothetical protein
MAPAWMRLTGVVLPENVTVSVSGLAIGPWLHLTHFSPLAGTVT